MQLGPFKTLAFTKLRLKLTYKEILVSAIAVNPTLYLFMLLHSNPQLLEEVVAAPLKKETKGEEVITINIFRTYTALINYTC